MAARVNGLGGGDEIWGERGFAGGRRNGVTMNIKFVKCFVTTPPPPVSGSARLKKRGRQASSLHHLRKTHAPPLGAGQILGELETINFFEPWDAFGLCRGPQLFDCSHHNFAFVDCMAIAFIKSDKPADRG